MSCELRKYQQPELVVQEILQSVRSLGWSELTLCKFDWKRGTQEFIYNLVREKIFTHVVNSPTQRDALLDIYIVRSESSFTASSIVQGISYHHGVIQEAELEENWCVPQVENLVPVYQKRDVILQDKLWVWASNFNTVKEICNNFNVTVPTRPERFFPHKLLRKKRTVNTATGTLNV